VPEKSVVPTRSAEAEGLDVGLGVAAVARRLGVAPGTLRTWARRYGIEPTGHEAGTQRRYNAADLSRLTQMRRLMLDGVSAADAAKAALDQPAAPRRGLRRGRVRETAPPRRRRGGGGQVVPLRDASPEARGLARAAMALDPRACADLLDSSLGRRGVLVTWQDMVIPVLGGVGDRWRATGRGVEIEHLLTECVEDALREVTRHISQPRRTAPVLLASPDIEAHDLALHALAAALAESSVAVRMFGASVPMTALADAVSRVGAAVVFLWAQGAARRLDPASLSVIPELRPRPLLVLGGPGWRSGGPRGPGGPGGPGGTDHAVRRVDDLAGAVQAVLGGLGLDVESR
jgi:MerR family transcriptional regulator, light-induced transcriptional regulator